MINKLTVLNTLELYIARYLNDYLDEVEGMDIPLPRIIDKSVSQTFPAVDSQPMPNMFNLVVTYEENESLSVGSDLCTLNVSVFITCKRDKSSNLQKKVNGYATAFQLMLWHHQNLDGLVDMCDVTNADYYPAVEGDINVAGVEMTITIQYAKEYC